MTPEQRYLLDTTGYIHIKNVLSPEELEKAKAATDRLINTPDEDIPEGLERMGTSGSHTPYHRGFAFDRALEHLTMHRRIWGDRQGIDRQQGLFAPR